jgi:hypothetical protein
MKKLACLALFAAATLCAKGDSFPDLLEAAQSHFKAGRLSQALDAVSQAKVVVFEMAPLQFSRCLYVEAPATAYGVYTARKSAVFTDGDTIDLYCEPVGYTFQRRQGMYRFSFATDFQLLDAEQRVLASQENFSAFAFESHQPNTELLININYRFTGVKTGSYTLRTTLKDVNSGKTTTRDLPLIFK